MADSLGINSIYVIHALKGYERHEARIRTLFAEQNLPFTLVTEGDPAVFDAERLPDYFTPDAPLSVGVRSCTLNHMLAYEEMIRRGDNLALVFENDPFFLGDFRTALRRVVQETQTLEPGFMVSLENTTLQFPSYSQTRTGQYLYPASAGRCAGAYLIDRTAAIRILDDLKTHKCSQVIDWWHNGLIERGVVRMYWAHPTLVEQGSHNGQLSSTISTKSKSLGRQLRWTLQKLYKTYVRRLFPEKRLLNS